MLNLNYCNPCIEASGSELCFISHPEHKRQLSCDPGGKIEMKQNWQGWEVWRFTKKEKSGNFLISSWTHDHKVLCSDSNGRVYSDDKKMLVEGDNLMQGEWTIAIHPVLHGITIKSVKHGRYLVLCDNGLVTSSDQIETDPTTACWHLDSAHRNHFFISSKCHDKRLACTIENTVRTFNNRKEWEKWVVEPTNDELGHFTIRSLEHGVYLGSLKDGTLVSSGSKQSWYIVPSPNKEGIFIQSVEHHHYLSCNVDGILSTQKECENFEVWNLEPILPSTVSLKNYRSWALIGVATVAAAVAAPFAVTGIVGAMGFGIGGIEAGSIAAGMMSAEALAAGGGVAAGGTVATLQSIGAVGLGLVGSSVAATTGAVAGGLTSLSVAAASGGLNNNQEQIRLENAGSQLPLCAWQLWHLLIKSQ